MIKSFQKVRIYDSKKFENCPIDVPMKMFLEVPKLSVNGFNISGYVTVTDEVRGDVDMVIEATRCSIDMKSCEKYQNINIREMCTNFGRKNRYYTAVFAAIKPKVECPIKPGNYTLESTRLDLSGLRMFPLEGFVWILTFKLVSIEKKSKKVVFCLISELEVTRGSRRSK